MTTTTTAKQRNLALKVALQDMQNERQSYIYIELYGPRFINHEMIIMNPKAFINECLTTPMVTNVDWQ